MDFKVNAWTVLFAIATIAAVYFCMCNCETLPTDVEIASKACKRCVPPPKDYKISNGEADRWIENYKKYAARLTDTSVVKNPNVRYFQLPRCEMVEMINDIGEDSDVKAHLGIDNSTGLIKLVFEDTPKKGTGTANGGGGGFFDFTRPCPPICDE